MTPGACSPVVLGQAGIETVVPIRAVVDHINGKIDLYDDDAGAVTDRQAERKREQWRQRYQTNLEFRERKMEYERRRRRERYQNDPDYRAREKARQAKYRAIPEVRERRLLRERQRRAENRTPREPDPRETEIEEFLAWSEDTEKAKVKTLERRRAALRAYFRFVDARDALEAGQ